MDLQTLFKETKRQNELFDKLIKSESFQEMLKECSPTDEEKDKAFQQYQRYLGNLNFDYQDYKGALQSLTASNLLLISQALANISVAHQEFNAMFEDYTNREKEIKNPTLLKFIQDYKNDQKV